MGTSFESSGGSFITLSHVMIKEIPGEEERNSISSGVWEAAHVHPM